MLIGHDELLAGMIIRRTCDGFAMRFKIDNVYQRVWMVGEAGYEGENCRVDGHWLQNGKQFGGFSVHDDERYVWLGGTAPASKRAEQLELF